MTRSALNYRTIEASSQESGDTEHQLRHQLQALSNDRQILIATFDEKQEAWHASEQRLRKKIGQLKGDPEAKAHVGGDIIARMGIVMNEAQRFLHEQQTRLDAAEKERDEVGKRLLDTLSHLEGPEYAELVVATALRAASNEQPLHAADTTAAVA